LGEFSTIGAIVYIWQLLTITEVAQFRCDVLVLTKKLCPAGFGAILSQTHLATLIAKSPLPKALLVTVVTGSQL
jgi:hypothetical protein